MIKKYVKLPVEIEAVFFCNNDRNEIIDWLDSYNIKFVMFPNEILIETLKGEIKGKINECYIIKGITDEFYCCEREVFNKTYKEVGE